MTERATGPWDSEPNAEVFTHAGLVCRIERNSLGALEGYVTVSQEHPLYGRHYSAADCQRVAVHGGLVYSAAAGVGWELGFDCAHPSDFVPGLALRSTGPENYRNIEYTRSQCRMLADQLQKLQKLRNNQPEQC